MIETRALLKSPVFSPRRRESQMTVGTSDRPVSASAIRGSRLGMYVFGKVRDFVLYCAGIALELKCVHM